MSNVPDLPFPDLDPRAHHPAGDPARPLVLLLERCREDVERHTRALVSAGCDVITVGHVEEAVRAASRFLPSLLVLEVRRPEVEALLRALAQDDRISPIPAIVLAEDADPAVRHAVLPFRPAEFHVKPISPAHLARAVLRTLDAMTMEPAAYRLAS